MTRSLPVNAKRAGHRLRAGHSSRASSGTLTTNWTCPTVFCSSFPSVGRVSKAPGVRPALPPLRRTRSSVPCAPLLNLQLLSTSLFFRRVPAARTRERTTILSLSSDKIERYSPAMLAATTDELHGGCKSSVVKQTTRGESPFFFHPPGFAGPRLRPVDPRVRDNGRRTRAVECAFSLLSRPMIRGRHPRGQQ